MYSNMDLIRRCVSNAAVLLLYGLGVFYILVPLGIICGAIPVTMIGSGIYDGMDAEAIFYCVAYACVFLNFSWIIKERSNSLTSTPYVRMVAWAFLASTAFHVPLNAISTSTMERYVIAPIESLTVILCFIVAMGPYEEGDHLINSPSSEQTNYVAHNSMA